jgi:hypothetical protein
MAVFRYIALNRVKAGLLQYAADWPWPTCAHGRCALCHGRAGPISGGKNRALEAIRTTERTSGSRKYGYKNGGYEKAFKNVHLPLSYGIRYLPQTGGH